MGKNSLPPFEIVSNEEAQKIGKPNYGYAFKAFEEILKAHKTGNSLKMTFGSVNTSNKMVGQIAVHADAAGFNLFTRREHKQPIRFFWLEQKDKEEQKQ